MSEEKKTVTPEGNVTETSGSVEGKDQDKAKQDTTPETKEDVSIDPSKYVSRSTYEKAVKELKNFREALRNKEKEDLEKQEKYKELYEIEKKRSEERDQELAQLKELTTTSKKLGALRDELEKLGCNKQYLDKAIKFADMNKIIVDDETGVITGADLQAKLVSEDVPPFFQPSKVGVSHQAPAGLAKPISIEDWQKLSYEDRQKLKKEVYEQHGIQLRK